MTISAHDMSDRACICCSKAFTPKITAQKYCGRKCQDAYRVWGGPPPEPTERICHHCSTPFMSRKKRKKYCHSRCELAAARQRKRVEYIRRCKVCDAPVAGKMYCSEQCEKKAKNLRTQRFWKGQSQRQKELYGGNLVVEQTYHGPPEPCYVIVRHVLRPYGLVPSIVRTDRDLGAARLLAADITDDSPHERISVEFWPTAEPGQERELHPIGTDYSEWKIERLPNRESETEDDTDAQLDRRSRRGNPLARVRGGSGDDCGLATADAMGGSESESEPAETVSTATGAACRLRRTAAGPGPVGAMAVAVHGPAVPALLAADTGR